MGDRQVKAIRSQIRNVALELLPDMTAKVTSEEMYKLLNETIKTRLDIIEKEVRATLEAISNRARDVESLIMGEVARQSAAAAETQPTPEAAPIDNA